MALKRSTLNMLSFLYFLLSLGVWVGWQVETDRRMERDENLFQQQLQADGMSATQAFNIRQAMRQAYDHATSYASTAIFVVILSTQGMASILIASLPEDRHDAPVTRMTGAAQ